MMERKTNYFKEIHSSMDTFLALLLGLLLGLGVYAVDKFDLVTWAIGRFQITGLYAELIMAGLMSVLFASVGLLILLMLPKLFSKNVVKTDFILLTYDASMLTMLVTTALGLNGLTHRLILWASLLGVGLLLTVIRMICVRSHEGEDRLQMKDYMSILSKKYNFPLLTVIAILLGTGLGVFAHYFNVNEIIASAFAPWAELTKHQKYGYVSGAIVVLLVGLISVSMASGKKNKVCFLDALLYVVTGSALMSGVFFAYGYPDHPTFKYLTWICVVAALVLTLLVRSLFVSVDVNYKPRTKGLRAYYGKLAEEKSIALIVLISAFIVVGLTVIDLVGLVNCFSTPLHIGVSIALIVVLLAIGLIGLCSLVKGKLKDSKINVIDGVLNVAFVTGTFLIFNLCNLLGLIKFAVWAVVYVIVILFILVRARYVVGDEPVKEEPVVEEQKVEETVAEETPVVEETVSEEAPVTEEVREEIAEEDEGDEESVEGEDYSRLNNIRRLSFAEKLALASDDTLRYYSEIKNALLSYGTKSRQSRRNEAFRKSGLVAKISISGKSLRLHLPLDPNSEEFSRTKYHQIDLSAKKQYAEVAFTMRIKSDRALKRALELIAKVCEDRGLKLRKGYVPVDFASELRKTAEPVAETEVELTPEVVTEETSTLSIRRSTYGNKLKFASEQTKEYYSTLKNALLSYGTKSRPSKKNEAFRKSGLVAKLSLSGKSIRLHLPLDPNSEELSETRYHQIDLSAKKQYAEVPFTVKVKSERGLKRALELITKVCEERGLKLRRNYEEVNFAKELELDGEAIFEKLGCKDAMTSTFNPEYLRTFKENHKEAYEDLMTFIPVVKKEIADDGETHNVYLDTALEKMNEDLVNIETLRKVYEITSSVTHVVIKIHDNLTRKITVYCDEISVDAALAVLALGGKVFLTK